MSCRIPAARTGPKITTAGSGCSWRAKPASAPPWRSCITRETCSSPWPGRGGGGAGGFCDDVPGGLVPGPGEGRAMTWIGLRLDPLDTLFFRDGRPFDAASRASGGLPLPQTFAGAVRTYLLARAGFDFAAL